MSITHKCVNCGVICYGSIKKGQVPVCPYCHPLVTKEEQA